MIQGSANINPTGVGPCFAGHIVDVEVDPETGKVEILRYTAVQDVGTAIHPSYVEGQMQGGAMQGIGMALTEEYVYDESGRMENPTLLDYPHAERARPPDDRDHRRRGPQPRPSLRRARRRRGADRPRPGSHRGTRSTTRPACASRASRRRPRGSSISSRGRNSAAAGSPPHSALVRAARAGAAAIHLVGNGAFATMCGARTASGQLRRAQRTTPHGRYRQALQGHRDAPRSP